MKDQTRTDIGNCCDCRGFLKFPQGHHAAQCVFLSFLTLILVCTGMGSCNFATVTGSPWGLLWRRATAAEQAVNSRAIHCISWSAAQKDFFDAPWKTGMAFAYLSIIIIVLASAATFALSCASFNSHWLALIGLLFLVGSITQVLSFIIFASKSLCTGELVCRPAFGAGITVGSILFTLLTAGSLFVMRYRLAKKARNAAGPRHATVVEDPTTVEENHEVQTPPPIAE